MKKQKKEYICKFCGKRITHIRNKIYHDSSLVFPQYCLAVYGGKLHEPKKED